MRVFTARIKTDFDNQAESRRWVELPRRMTSEERALLDALDDRGRAWVEGTLSNISADDDALFAALAESDAQDDDPSPK